MRALFFALAALSLFAVFSAYYQEMSNSIEEFPFGYGLDNAIGVPYAFCMDQCPKRHFSSKQCLCACKAIKGWNVTMADCHRACHCVDMSKAKCAGVCKYV